MPLSPGNKLGPYQILSALGAGGMGEVWKARDTRLDRIVAIKTLKGQHSARFEQEARAIAALNHPHICQIFDIGPDYLVLEYVEGKPLKGPLPPEQAWTLARQIASALEAAHAKGILHRDLKPGNILVNSSGAKLLDFGLAKLMDDGDATQTVGIAGTPLYMSPEQVEGKPLDTRSDVFSFGVVIYELLTGRRPFDSLASVLRDEPTPSGHEVITKCLAKQPVQRFESMTLVLAALRETETKPAAQIPSIAVLPFANMSGDKEQEYFSDGLAEEIINALVKIPGLKVIARTSAFAFKGHNTDIRKIAETLGVANILEGSVRRSGNRIRITAQLITASDGSHLWSERYDRELADVFAVQDEISAAIAGALQAKLSPHPSPKSRYKPKLPAYEAYLKARHYHWKLTPEALTQAKEFYERAIALDPQYALAQALYADTFFLSAHLGITPAHEAMPVARAMAERALELDASLPEAHAILCGIAASYDYDWKEATRRFTLATANDAASPWSLAFLGVVYLLASGRRTEAIEQTGRAVQGDPLAPASRGAMASSLAAASRYAEAEAHYRQVLDFDPNNAFVYYQLALLYSARHMLVEALPFAEKAYSLAPWMPHITGAYAGLLIRTGEQDRGQEVAQRLGSGETYGTPIGLAGFHLLCGEVDFAADWVEKAIEERFPTVAWLLQSPVWEPLRASPRWPKLAAMMNLPAESS